MGNGEILEMIAFILYLVLVMGIGVFFFIKGRKQTGDKAYLLRRTPDERIRCRT